MTYFGEEDGILTVKYNLCLLAVSCVNSCSFELKKEGGGAFHCYQLYVTPASYAGVLQLESRPGDLTVFGGIP
jgi:hypothetical protein